MDEAGSFIGIDTGSRDLTCVQAVRRYAFGMEIIDYFYIEPSETFDVENERVS